MTAPTFRIAVLLSFLVVTTIGSGYQKHQGPWVPDNGDGTYRNPIIAADYSDPDVIRVGDDFYLTASSFNCAPGLPILHSKDLINWRIIGHVFQQQSPIEVFNKPQHGNGVWAPSIRYHHGQFYIFYGDPDFGIYMTKARNAAGPWSTPLLIRPAKGWIDTCPFWDDDGKGYLVHAWANSRSGIKSILTINRLSEDGTRLLDEGQMVFDGHKTQPTIEGPKLYKRNGYYYIFAPAGGVTNGWQTVLRSRNIFGPYEERIVMDQGTTSINGPHQGGWVELNSGESWFIHFQDRGAYGRVSHLQPMKWIEDWPVIGVDNDGDGKGEPVTTYMKPNVGSRFPVETPQTNDEFTNLKLGLQWQWHANPKSDWLSLDRRKGWLRLKAARAEGDNLWSVPNLLLQKLPAFAFTTTTKIDLVGLNDGERAGLLIMGMDYSYIGTVKRGTKLVLVKAICKDAPSGAHETNESETEIRSSAIYLRVTVKDGVCRFAYSSDGGRFNTVGAEFTAKPGRWIGAKVGLFAIASGPETSPGYVDIDWFRFE